MPEEERGRGLAHPPTRAFAEGKARVERWMRDERGIHPDSAQPLDKARDIAREARDAGVVPPEGVESFRRYVERMASYGATEVPMARLSSMGNSRALRDQTHEQAQRQPGRPLVPREAGREAAVTVHQWLQQRGLETYWVLDRKDVASIARAAWREGTLSQEARQALGRELAQEPPGKLVEVGRIIEAAAWAARRSVAEERTPGGGREVDAFHQRARDDHEARVQARQAAREPHGRGGEQRAEEQARGWGQSWEPQREHGRER